MKILLLCKKVPFPLRDGESVAIHNMVTSLKKIGYEVDLLSFNTTKHKTIISEHPKYSYIYDQLYTVPLDNSIVASKALKNLFSSESYHIERFITPEFDEKLSRVLNLNTYDFVQLESVFLAPYIDTIRKLSDAKIVLRTHNVETRIWSRLAKSAPFLKRKYLELQCKRLEKFESITLEKVDHIITMSNNDAVVLKEMGMLDNYSIIPISIDVSKYESEFKILNKKIGFIGSLDWRPNIEGLEWFIENVWNELQKANSDIQFHVAGRAPSESLVKLMEDAKVIYQGEVRSAQNFITSNMILVVPLHSGSGLRVKILEAMSLGIPVVTTTIGAEGINVVDDESIIIADDAQQMISDIQSILIDIETYFSIANNSKQVIQQYYNSEIVAQQFNDVYTSLR